MIAKAKLGFDFKRISQKMLKFWRIIWGKTAPQRLFRYYFLVVLIGAILLITPIAVTTYQLKPVVTYEGVKYIKWNFFYALFIAASGFSDTGLTMINISKQFTVFGQVVLLVLIQIGGIGYTAIKVCLLFFLGRRFGLQEKIELDFERGNQKIGSSVRLIRFVLLFIFSLEIIATFILSLYLYLSPDISNNTILNHSSNNLGNHLHNSYGLALWYGLFTSISSLNNAGWYLFGSSSFIAFASDYFIQFFIIILTILGGIGFPIYYEVWVRFMARIRKKNVGYHSFSLFSKIAILAYFAIMAIGLFALSMSELGMPADSKIPVDGANGKAVFQPPILHDPHSSGWQKFMFLFFTTVSSRSTGFTIINLQRFGVSSKIILAILMWIGGSPTSASGGIRTTTFFIAFLFIFYYFLGIKKPHIFRRTINSDTIKRSYMVIFLTTVLVVITGLIIYTSTFGLSTSGYKYTFVDAILEAASAFGTTGFTTGLTSVLNIPSLIFIFILMFIGQLTMSGTLLSFTKKTNFHNYAEYPSEDVAIG